MKKLQFLLFLMLFAASAIAQEYATREIRLRVHSGTVPFVFGKYVSLQ